MTFPLLPRRKAPDKSAYGHVLVLAGSRAYPGAALLTASAALRSGSGLVTLGTVSSARAAVLKRFPAEVMPVFFPETSAGSLAPGAYSRILALSAARRINAAAVGPGLTNDPRTANLVRRLVRRFPAPLVLDADGLNAFRGHRADLKKHAFPLVLTPHEREFERLFGESCPAAAKKREALAKRLSRSYDVVLVLKSHRTLVVSHDKMFWNTTGNPGMAKGGSGDALTGVIAAFLAQGLNPFKAAAWGVYFHGKAGDLAGLKTGELSLTASDLIERLPDVFRWSSSAGRATVL